MKRILTLLFILAVVSIFSLQAQSTMTLRGVDDMGNRLIYDSDLNITWYDYTNSKTTWQNQVDWAEALTVNFGGTVYDDWRLPTTVDGPIVDPWDYTGTTTAGYNITTSEMGHLFYEALGNIGQVDTAGITTGCVADPSPKCLTNTGDFQNLADVAYWSGTEFATDPLFAWRFLFYNGVQNIYPKDDLVFSDGGYYALAVRPGDVSAVPSITVTSPNSGEELSAGEIFDIAWKSEGDIDFVKIQYSVNNGTDWVEVIESTENDGSYNWKVPCDLSDESLVRISDVDTDASDESDGDFSIIDDLPPSVQIFVDIDHLWPPNHKMVDVGFDYSITDNCDQEPDISTWVTSDEPTATASGAGGPKMAPDAKIDNSVSIRAERSGNGDGRVYQINVNVADESGNSSSASIPVKVNLNKKVEAIDSDQSYDATTIN